MLSFNEINDLGEVIETTWGKSSTKPGPRDGSMSIKASLEGDVLTIMYTVVCNIVTDHRASVRDQVKGHADQSIKATNEYLKNVKKGFKDLSGRALKTKKLGTDDQIELITMSAYNPRKTAYYRRYTKIKCE